MDTSTWEELARTAYFEYAKAVGIHTMESTPSWEALRECERIGWRNSVARTSKKLAQLAAEGKR